MPSFVLYLPGFVILATGILFGTSILGVDNQWVAVIGLVLLGIGVITGVAKTRRQRTVKRQGLTPASPKPTTKNPGEAAGVFRTLYHARA